MIRQEYDASSLCNHDSETLFFGAVSSLQKKPNRQTDKQRQTLLEISISLFHLSLKGRDMDV